MDAFFKDLKVVELASVLAGPLTGTFFSELGADVLKVENSSGGDVTRSWRSAGEPAGMPVSAYYASANFNKKSIFVNLNDAAERQQVYAHIRTADIVIANYKAGDAEKFGMDYPSLKQLNPSLIYASISGFGEGVQRTAYDLVLQAETGFMYMNGTPESGPVKMPVALIDVLAAHQLKEGILTALIRRLKTGEGAHVSVSLYDAAVASLANQAGNWLMTGHNPQPIGSLHPNIAPYGELFETADGRRIVLAVGSNRQFGQLCHVLGCDALATDPRFTENTLRVQHRHALQQLLQPYFREASAETLLQQFIRQDVPAGIVYPLSDVFQSAAAQSLIQVQRFEKDEVKSVKSTVFRLN